MDFYELIEDWCCGVKDLQHDNTVNKRFYICDGYLGMTDFMREHTPEKSPCVLADSSMTGVFTTEHDTPNYTLYFAVRAKSANDDRAALVARKNAKELAKKFVNYIWFLKNSRDADYEMHGSNFTMAERREVVRQIDTKHISYDTMGPFYEGWHAVMLMLECPLQPDVCLNQQDYVENWI